LPADALAGCVRGNTCLRLNPLAGFEDSPAAVLENRDARVAHDSGVPSKLVYARRHLQAAYTPRCGWSVAQHRLAAV